MNCRLALVSFATVFIAACLPERNNGADPAIRPTAVLRIVDRGGAYPTCAATDPSGWQEVASAPFARCLALDGSLSADPQGVPLTYEFAWKAADGTWLPIVNDGSTAPLDRTFLYGTVNATVSSSLTFAMTVIDGNGIAVRDTADVMLFNTRPVAHVSDPLALPIGGLPWALTSSLVATVSGSGSSDPDGDPLTYCWTFPPNGVDPQDQYCGTPGDATATRTIASAVHSRTGVTLVVNDGKLDSLPVTTDIQVRETSQWAYGIKAGRLSQLDTTRAELVNAGAGKVAAGYYDDRAPATAPRVVFANSTGPGVQNWTMRISEWPSLRPIPLTAPFQVAQTISALGLTIVGDPAHDRVFAIADLVASNVVVHTYGVLPKPELTPQNTASISVPGNSRQFFADVDASGELWFARSDAPQVSIVSTAGVASQASIPGSQTATVTGLARRPGPSGEIWILSQEPIGSPASAPARLIRYRPGTNSFEEFAFQADSARGVAWASENELWMSVLGEGVVRIDVRLLDITGRVEDAIVFAEPSVLSASNVVADPVDGTCWTGSLTLQNGGARILRDGSILQMSGVDLVFVDREGSVWYRTNSGGKLSRGQLTTDDAVAYDVAAPVPLASAVDYASGDLVTYFQPPNEYGSITRFSLRAEPRFSITRIRNSSGSESPFPSYSQFRFAPDLGRAFGFGPGGIDLLDLTQSPPRQTAAAIPLATENAILTTGAMYNGPVFLPSAPGVATPFSWAVTGGAAPKIAAITDAGATTTPFTIPAAEIIDPDGNPGFFVARSPATSAACVAGLDASATQHQIKVRYITPAGVVTQIGVRNVSATARLFAVTASSELGVGDLCWIAYFAGNQDCTANFGSLSAEAFKGNGTGLAHLAFGGTNGTIQFLPLEASASSSTQVWTAGQSCDRSSGLTSFQILRVDFAGNGATFQTFPGSATPGSTLIHLTQP